jgi:hypothetical protein
MARALWESAQQAEQAQVRQHGQAHGWSRKMSDHIAYALLVYTALNIVLTIGAIKDALQGSILPYFSLVLLVAAIIPACRTLEKRWERLDAESADEVALKHRFVRDRAMVWIAAIVIPLVITGAFKLANAVA